MAHMLVTGGAGFIGSHVVDALVARKHRVHVIDDLSSGQRKNVHPHATLHIIDIRSKKILPLLKNIRPALLFHLAAQKNLRTSIADPLYDADVNILGTLNLLEAAIKAKVKKTIFSSSGGAIYDEIHPVPTPEKVHSYPVSPYGVSKLVSEYYLKYYQRAKRMSSVSLRYANVFGPRQDPTGEGGVIAIFCRRLLAGRPLFINGRGKQTRDFVYVDDVVKANLKSMRTEVTEPLNIGTGHETSIRTLATTLMQISGTQVPLKYKPLGAGDVLRSAIHPAQAKKVLGWQPQTSFASGLRQTWNWAREEMMA
jgi:UDP-glucose 4-epimerase